MGPSPRAGRRIVITRPEPDADRLADRLRALGATPVVVPAIRIEFTDPPELDDALGRITGYDWVVFTSRNGVEAVFRRTRSIAGPRVAAREGGPVAQAKRQIVAAHLVADVKHVSSENVPVGVVVKQDPAAGKHVAKGGTVTLWVSSGPPKVPVPDVKGKQWTDAQQILIEQGLKPEEHIVPGPTKGQVTATDPTAGKSVPKGSTVRVNVWSGPAQASVPNVVGDTVQQATAALNTAGFNYNLTYVDNDAPQGQIIHQNPAAGTSKPKGTTVELQVSNGPPPVDVPTVVGETAQQAVSDLESQGFKVSQQYVTVTDPSQDGIVISQTPDGGSQQAKGSTVTIEVGQTSGPPPPPGTGRAAPARADAHDRAAAILRRSGRSPVRGPQGRVLPRRSSRGCRSPIGPASRRSWL